MYKSLFHDAIAAARAAAPGALHASCWLPAVLAGLLLAGPALAQQEDDDDDDEAINEFELTPFVGYSAGGEFEDPNSGGDRDLNPAASFGLIADLTTDDPSRHYELLYSYQSTDVDGTPKLDLDVQYLHVGGVVDFVQERRRAIPFVAGGLGVTLLSPDRNGLDDETEFSLSLGGGFKIPLNDRIGIRFDARAFITFLDSDTSVFCVSAPPTAACDIRAKSDSFLQFTASVGITAGF
jgi:hypothetical protein